MNVSVDLLQWLWTVTLVTSAVVCVMTWLPRILRKAFGARVAYTAWWLLPIVLIACCLPARIVDADGSATTVPEPLILPVKMALDTVPQHIAQTSAEDMRRSIIWLALWSLGALAMAFHLGWQQRQFQRALGVLLHLQADLWRAQANHGLPALLGGLRTRIVLPEDFERRFDQSQQRLMLAHERLHRHRGDHLANLSLAILRCLFWFNPLIHWAATRFRHDQELACDEAVIAAHPHLRRTYGEAMLKTLTADRQVPLGCHWGFSHPLKERIMQLNTSPPRTWVRCIGLGSIVMLSLGLGIAAWLSQPARSIQYPSISVSANENDGVYFESVLVDPNAVVREHSRASGWIMPRLERPPLHMGVNGVDRSVTTKQTYRVERNARGGMTLHVRLRHFAPLPGQAPIPQLQTLRFDINDTGETKIKRAVGQDGYHLLIFARRGVGPCSGGPAFGIGKGAPGDHSFKCVEQIIKAASAKSTAMQKSMPMPATHVKDPVVETTAIKSHFSNQIAPFPPLSAMSNTIVKSHAQSAALAHLSRGDGKIAVHLRH
jgi:beta-lactamase regulating signal transducer with metallopeptidase domain